MNVKDGLGCPYIGETGVSLRHVLVHVSGLGCPIVDGLGCLYPQLVSTDSDL